MKRDMDLVRQILLAVEDAETGGDDWLEIDIEGYTELQVYYHVMLLAEAGLIEAEDLSTMDPDHGVVWKAKRLTWWGHEFLDAARNDNIWQKAKEKAGNVAGSVTFEVMKELLIATAKEKLGLAA